MVYRRLATLSAALLACGSCDATVGGSSVGSLDGGADAAGPAFDATPAEAMPEIYDTDRTLSPITPFVAANLRAISERAAMRGELFAKLGASATVSLNFMHCFAGNDVDLGGRTELSVTIDRFLAGDAAGTNPFQRQSLSATVGWSAGAALAGSPSPLEQEIDALSPRFAIIMYGTNDIQQGSIDRFGENLLDIADQLISRGVVPVFTTIMPRGDSASANLEVPRYNAVVRAVAQSRQVPLIDFHRELLPLADNGLGGDGIHPSVLRDPGARACVLTDAGLKFGYNIRNLLTIQSLARLQAVLLDGGPAPDAPARSQRGSGSAMDPFIIQSLPFTHLADTGDSTNRAIDSYPGCNATQDESGGEFIYRFDVAAATRVRAFAVDRGGADIDVHVLRGSSTGDACIARDNNTVVMDLEPGTYYFSLDSFVSRGTALEGEYMFVLQQELP